MNTVEKLRKVLRDRVEIYIPQEEIAVESVQLYADEMDENFHDMNVTSSVKVHGRTVLTELPVF